MRTELLYTTGQGYMDGTYAEIDLYDGAFLQVFGRGTGTIEWDGTAGDYRVDQLPAPSSRRCVPA